MSATGTGTFANRLRRWATAAREAETQRRAGALGGSLRRAARRVQGPLAPPSWPESLPRPAKDRGLGTDFETEWSRRYPARLLRAMVLDNVTRPVTRIVADPVLRGREHLRDLETPAIFVANHASHLDTPLLLSCLPVELRHRTVVAAAADYFFDRRWKGSLWALLLAAVPIERNRVSRTSAALAASLVDEGWNLVIFPEGGRTPDGWGQEFRGGAAYLAIRTGRPVVPVHLDGTRHVLPKSGNVLRRSRVTVTFGTPMRAGEGEDARKFSARIEHAIAVLADERRSDWWEAARRAATGSTPPLSGPATSPWRRSWALPEAPAWRDRDPWPEMEG